MRLALYPRRLFGLNVLFLVGAVSLLAGFVLTALSQYDRRQLDNALSTGILILLSGFYLLLSIRIFHFNERYLFYPADVNDHPKWRVVIPFTLSFLVCISSPMLSSAARQFAFRQVLQTETPLKISVADVCTHLFIDPAYLSHISRTDGNDGYFIIGDNDYVFIWQDGTGDAYWFDIADSLSAFGYICIRPGLTPEEAITHYGKKSHEILPMYDNLYWWN